MRLISLPPLRHILCISALAGVMTGSPALAATFNVFKAGTSDLLGAFDAPAGGGLLTAASLSLKGGVFDVLGLGGLAPVFDPIELDVDGNGGAFGAVFNSVAFLTTDIVNNPVNCGVGDCVFSFDGSASPVPGSWYLDYVGSGGAAALAFGFYDIAAAPVPVPMTAMLLLGAVGLLMVARRKHVPSEAVAA